MSDVATAAALGEFLSRHDLDADSVRELRRVCRDRLAADVAEIAELNDAGRLAVPDLAADDLLADPGGAHRDLIRRRGCAVLRGTFEPDEAADWDARLGAYLEANGFDDHAAGSGIRGIYWSKPQVEARQHPRMVAVRRCLNSIWNHPKGTDGDGDGSWFDPDHDIGYADRVRRRPPGVDARGLPLHADSPASRGWRQAENQRVFRHLFDGHPERHDPWDAAHRTGADDVSGAPSGAFRTFQGWTALSEARPEDGGLTVVPTLRAIDDLIIAGLARDIEAVAEPAAAHATSSAAVDELLAAAVTRMPTVRPGDTVWWHGDLVHGVDPAANDSRWSNVMYIPASPRCPRNDAYGATMLARFDAGRSPIDFPADDLETRFVGRATRDDLNEVGRAQFGLDPISAAGSTR